MKIAAFDIGGTALKMGVMARDGRLLETARQSINDSDGDRILQAMLSWLAAHPSCEGIAISAPGYIDPHSGLITMGGAIRRFDNFAMKSWLETRT
ncbi:ROK family protein, partial [Pseudomonas aeruginosa]|nr:ROK family protein [Pseudomonas aeruginosa]